MLNCSEADWFHIDIMDAGFVPNISLNACVARHCKNMRLKPLSSPAMIVDPDRYVKILQI
jgi:pentose-5-phosphate-3-epimerase